MSLVRVVKREFDAVQSNVARHLRYHFFEEQQPKPLHPGQDTMIFLHGFMQSEAAFLLHVQYLQERNINVRTKRYSFLGDLRDVGEEVYEDAKKLQEQTGTRIDLCGHSLGALIALNTAVKAPDVFRKVIGLGMPYHGTRVAAFGAFLKSCRQMLPESNYLQELHKTRIPEELEVYSVRGERDYALGSPDQAVIPDGYHPCLRNIQLHDHGHLSLLEEPGLIYEIMKNSRVKVQKDK